MWWPVEFLGRFFHLTVLEVVWVLHLLVRLVLLCGWVVLWLLSVVWSCRRYTSVLGKLFLAWCVVTAPVWPVYPDNITDPRFISTHALVVGAVKGGLRAFDGISALPGAIVRTACRVDVASGLSGYRWLSPEPLNETIWPAYDTALAQFYETPSEFNERALLLCSDMATPLEDGFPLFRWVEGQLKPVADALEIGGFRVLPEAPGICKIWARNGLLPVRPPNRIIQIGGEIVFWVSYFGVLVVIIGLFSAKHLYDKMYPWHKAKRSVVIVPAGRRFEVVKPRLNENETVEDVARRLDAVMAQDEFAPEHLEQARLFFLPSDYVRHIDSAETAGRIVPMRALNIRVGGLGYCLTTVLKDKTGCLAFYTGQSFELPTPPELLNTDNRRFLLTSSQITMLDVGTSGRRSVPRHIIDGVVCRMATEAGESGQLYDRCGAFLRSAFKSNEIKVEDLAYWVLLTTHLANRASLSAGNSVRTNIAFGSGIIAEFFARFRMATAIRDPSRSVPTPEKWDFPDILVPTYEVFANCNRASLDHPVRPENPNPFPDIRPTPDATPGDDSERCASPDGCERSLIDGEKSAGTSTHPESTSDRTDGDEGFIFMQESTIGELLPECPGPSTGGVGVGCGGEPERTTAARRQWRGVALDLDVDNERQPVATSVGDAILELVPVVRRSSTDSVRRWRLVLSGGELPGVCLQACYECALLAAQRTQGRRLVDGTPVSARHRVERDFGRRGRSACRVSTGEISPVRTCAQARDGVRKEDCNPNHENAVRAMGKTVSRKEKERVARSRKAYHRRVADESRRAGQDVP